MPKRSISDEEIALIKAMLDRGMKNKDIQFFFNRPERSVNSGRITGIRNGTYSNAKDIPAADAGIIEEFIGRHAFPGGAGAVIVPAAPVEIAHGPLAPETLMRLFEDDGSGTWRLTPGETDQHECKSAFGFKHAHKWLKAIAALANNRGGYLFFGVNDKEAKGANGEDLSHAVSGMKDEEFKKADPADFTAKVKATFDPTPRIQTLIIGVGGESVGVMFVEQHPSRPVIAVRNEGDIREGDIFFRYPGQSARIKYSDLRAILDDRDKSARTQILPMVERLLMLGPSHAMVADLEVGALTDGKHAIQIDEALLDKIAFIKEGEFDEKKGAPALRLLGEVKVAGVGAAPVKKGVVTRSDLIGDFLSQSTPLDPAEYVRFALEASRGEWLPIRYFASKGGMKKRDLVAFINETKATAIRKKTFIDRVNNKDAARSATSGKPAALLKKLKEGADIEAVVTAKEASEMGRAIQGFQRDTKIELPVILAILSDCSKVAEGNAASVVRRAVCRVDEIFFDLAEE